LGRGLGREHRRLLVAHVDQPQRRVGLHPPVLQRENKPPGQGEHLLPPTPPPPPAPRHAPRGSSPWPPPAADAIRGDRGLPGFAQNPPLCSILPDGQRRVSSGTLLPVISPILAATLAATLAVGPAPVARSGDVAGAGPAARSGE